MVPNYTGRFLDKLILLILKQTAVVRENVEEPEYPATRSAILKKVVTSLWATRDELHVELRGISVSPRKP